MLNVDIDVQGGVGAQLTLVMVMMNLVLSEKLLGTLLSVVEDKNLDVKGERVTGGLVGSLDSKIWNWSCLVWRGVRQRFSISLMILDDIGYS